MKKLLALLTALAVLTVAAGAFAAGGYLPWTANKSAQVQNVQGVAPVPAASACTTATGTKGTIATVTTTGYLGMKWNATDATGAAVTVKRSVNSNTAYMPESGGTVGLTPDITSVKFAWYSSAVSKTTTVCRELQ